MPNKLGVHALLFTDQWSDATAKTAIDKATRIGFDVIEALIFDPDAIDGKMTRRIAKDAGIGVSLGMALGQESDISSSDPAIARRGVETVERCLAIAEEAGSSAVSGITYAAFNRYNAPPTPTQRTQVVDALGRLADKAASRGLRLGLEPVNRYESFLVNTLDDASSIIREIGSKSLFVHVDTFHMNIEESDIAGAIARNIDLIGYAHVAESHRGVLGSGTFDFKTFFRTLARSGFTGGYTVESFSSAVLGPAIVGAVGLWRQAWTDADKVARDALGFLRAEIAAAEAGRFVW
jgi:D-psicose/D-tagatose/L-ribulose 3-epimerase